MAEPTLTKKSPARISLAKIGGYHVLAPKIALAREHCDELDSFLNGLARRSPNSVILDFKSVPLMDSQALELLWRWHTELKGRGCLLKITALNDVCRDILVATRLIGVFHVFPDLQAAVRN